MIHRFGIEIIILTGSAGKYASFAASLLSIEAIPLINSDSVRILSAWIAPRQVRGC